MRSVESTSRSASRQAPSDDVSWLLHEEGAQRRLSVAAVMSVDDESWRATIERIDLGDGIRVHLTEAKVKRPLTVEPHQQEQEPWALSHFSVKGRVRIELRDGLAAELAPSHSVLFRAVGLRARFVPRAGQTLRLVGFMLRHDRVEAMFGDTLPDLLRPLVDPNLQTSLVIDAPVNAAMRRLAASLFTQSLAGDLRRIFLEGSVMQLFAMQVATASSLPIPAHLSRSERSALWDARAALLADMRSPPSLADLAAKVGLSEVTLNSGFRALFGGSVYEVLRDERLEHARIALETTGIPVKQIAFRVGYSHVTNFISAFASRYGAPPGRYKRRYGDQSADVQSDPGTAR